MYSNFPSGTQSFFKNKMARKVQGPLWNRRNKVMSYTTFPTFPTSPIQTLSFKHTPFSPKEKKKWESEGGEELISAMWMGA